MAARRTSKDHDQTVQAPPNQVPDTPPEPAQNPNVPVNPPDPDEPMPQPEGPEEAVNPPDSETPQQGVDNRTRDDRQVPVNPE